MIIHHFSGGLILFVVIFPPAGAESTVVSPPPNCCPHNTSLDPVLRLCTGGEHPVLDCKGRTKFLLDPADEGHTIQINGTGFLRIGKIHAQPGQFCLVNLSAPRHGSMKTEAEGNEVAIACHLSDNPSKVHVREILLLFCYFVSLLSLVLVLVAHISLSDLRDIQGKCHMATVMGLLMGLTSLLVVQSLTNDINEFMCQMLAFFLYFWLLSAFFWLNVTAFNVWRSVLLFHVRINETSLFIGYCLYAWGMPLCLLMLTAAMDFLPEGYAVLRPHFGLNTCWFHDGITQWSYFYGPVAILLLLNCIFFVWTTVCLWTDYSTTCLPMKRRLKRRCLLSVKMFIVMGIGWVFELISSLDDDDSFLWFIMDAFNILQGVIILMVLVILRRRFWRAIHNRRPLGLDAPQWAINLFLADENDCTAGRHMEELKHLHTQSSEMA